MHEGLPLLGAGDPHMDVAAWLRGLGLEQYAPAFHDNAIDGEVLRELTADDLKDLGVTLVGHRRKLLAAIAILGAAPSTGDVAQSGASAPSVPAAARNVNAERRRTDQVAEHHRQLTAFSVDCQRGEGSRCRARR